MVGISSFRNVATVLPGSQTFLHLYAQKSLVNIQHLPSVYCELGTF